MTVPAMRSPDVVVGNHFTIFTFDLLTAAARTWVTEHCPDTTFFGGALVVEHRFARDLAAGMVEDGLVVA